MCGSSMVVYHNKVCNKESACLSHGVWAQRSTIQSVNIEIGTTEARDSCGPRQAASRTSQSCMKTTCKQCSAGSHCGEYRSQMLRTFLPGEMAWLLLKEGTRFQQMQQHLTRCT